MKALSSIFLFTAIVLVQTLGNPAYSQQQRYVSIFGKLDGSSNVSHFRDGGLNYEFEYPPGLAKVPGAEKDLIVKLVGLINQKHVELKFSRLPDAPDPRIAEQLISSNFLKSVPGCNISGKRNIRFGKGLTFTGSETLFHFRMGDEPFSTRLVLFSNRDQTYLITFFSTEDDAVAKQAFEQVLSSIQQNAFLQSQPPKDESWSFEKFNDLSKQISFDYPHGWRQERDPGKEFEVKFHGLNKDGLGGELVVSRSERNPAVSTDQFFDSYEQMYLKPLKNYQRQSTSHSTFGITRHEGLMTTSTFTAEGHLFRHLTAFFADGKYYYAIVLTGGVWSEREMRGLFDRILASCKVGQ